MSSLPTSHLTFLSLGAPQLGAEILLATHGLNIDWHRWRTHNEGIVLVVADRLGVPATGLDALDHALRPIAARLVATGLLEWNASGTGYRLTVRGRTVAGLPPVAEDADLTSFRAVL